MDWKVIALSPFCTVVFKSLLNIPFTVNSNFADIISGACFRED